MLSFVYDINFKESFKLLKETHNIEKLYEVIKPVKESEKVFNKMKEDINKYIDERGTK